MQTKNIKTEFISIGDHVQRFAYNEEKMAELVGSILRRGLIQPLTVKPDGKGYIVVAGHRRFEGCKRAGLDPIPCSVARGDDAAMAEITFAENFFRDDLSPVEQAVAIAKEYQSGSMTVEQLAAGFRRSVDWIKRQVAITEWPEDVLDCMHRDGISVAAAANLALVDDDSYRHFLIRNAVDNGVTARTTAGWLQAYRASRPAEIAEVLQGDENEAPLSPAAPQGICMCCGEQHRVDAMSHVPLCPPCIQHIRGPGSRKSL